MSSGLEHRDCTESLAAYVLGALPETESAQVELHLASCQECRAEFEWLRVAGDALPASVPQLDPPPALKNRVMNVVRAEAELLQAAGHGADRPQPRARRTQWWRLGSFAWRPAIALGTVCALALVVVLLTTGGGTATRRLEAQFLRPGWQGARAALIVHGTQARLVVSGLPAPTANHIDELWVVRGSGPPQPAGTFVVRSGSVMVARPVRPGDLVLMTVEPGRGSKSPTTPLVMRVHV